MLHEMFPKKLDILYAPKKPRLSDIFLCIEDMQIFIQKGDAIQFPTVEDALSGKLAGDVEEKSLRYLFSIDDTRYFTIPGIHYETASPEYQWVSARALRYWKPEHFAYAGLLGNQLHAWYTRSRYCGRCGEKTVHDEKERMMRCPSCGNLIYPQICPSVIVGVYNKGRLLVTHYSPRHKMVDNGKVFAPPKHESVIAGYVESGETAEETVRREVMEEVGLRVKNIRYLQTAPWPLSGTLLLGYFCEVDGDDTIHFEEDELADAAWKLPSEVDDHSQDIGLTGYMIELFRQGKITDDFFNSER